MCQVFACAITIVDCGDRGSIVVVFVCFFCFQLTKVYTVEASAAGAPAEAAEASDAGAGGGEISDSHAVPGLSRSSAKGSLEGAVRGSRFATRKSIGCPVNGVTRILLWVAGNNMPRHVFFALSEFVVGTRFVRLAFCSTSDFIAWNFIVGPS